MKRREFITLLGSAAAWPLAARAQQASVPLIGFLSSRSPEDSKPHLAGFTRGLEAFGYVDGKSATIEYRWANGQYDRLSQLANELISLRPAVIVAAGGAPSARAAKSATTQIPVFFVTSDALGAGLVASLNRPDGNVSGVDIMSGELVGKRLELLVQLARPGSSVAFLTNPDGVQSKSQIAEVQRAARALGRELLIVSASSDSGLDSSFSQLTKSQVGGLVVENDPFFDSRREHLIEFSAQRAIPTIYHIREFTVGGGLMSYGANLVDAYYQMGVLVGRALKGATVADLPIVRPTKFELALNLKTAKALGLVVPPNFMAIADEVID